MIDVTRESSGGFDERTIRGRIALHLVIGKQPELLGRNLDALEAEEQSENTRSLVGGSRGPSRAGTRRRGATDGD
jgi:hypothetical protein